MEKDDMNGIGYQPYKPKYERGIEVVIRAGDVLEQIIKMAAFPRDQHAAVISALATWHDAKKCI